MQGRWVEGGTKEEQRSGWCLLKLAPHYLHVNRHLTKAKIDLYDGSRDHARRKQPISRDLPGIVHHAQRITRQRKAEMMDLVTF